MNDVLTVDRRGLAKKLAKKPKSFIVFELLQNAWDEDVSRVDVTLEMEPGRPVCRISVTDDCPAGFQDLASVYTLFRDSKKAPDPTKRGRFELGEKLVIALAIEATIASTKGTITIDETGRHHGRAKRTAGTCFSGLFKMTREEYEEVLTSVKMAIAPKGIITRVNGEVLAYRDPLHGFETTLQTIRSDDDGNLVPTWRKAYVHIHDVLRGEKAHIYEMGIPVLETGDKWHYDVTQRVPVNWERNSVPPAYLRALRVEVLNAMHGQLTDEEATTNWVSVAAEDPECKPAAIKSIITKRFGEKAVIADPSDPEGTKLAMSQGYTVIPGKALSKGAWANVRASGVVLPAGQVTPSPKVYSPDGRPEHTVPEEEWTKKMLGRAAFARRLHQRLLATPLTVVIVREPTVPWIANYGRHMGYLGSARLCLNLSKLRDVWFHKPHHATDVLSLLVHEFGHYYSTDHLDAAFHDGLCELSAVITQIALDDPVLFGSQPEERI